MKTVKYWIIAYLDYPDGRRVPYLTFGGTSEESARAKGFDLLGGKDFEIVALRAGNEAEATQMWKRQRLEESGDLRSSVERVRHREKY